MHSTRSSQSSRLAWQAATLLMAAAPMAQAQVAPSQPAVYDAIVQLQRSVNALQATTATLLASTAAHASEFGNRALYNKTFRLSAGVICSNPDRIVVPAGKRLVLQHVSGLALTQAPEALISVSIHSAITGLRQVTVAPGAPWTATAAGVAYNWAVVSQSMTVYADDDLYVCAQTTLTSAVQMEVVVSGYFVNR